ncbi:hypothetical protein [Billgrantia gudaonensis]|uniref:Uncharacterized protein n=1 Tax=Billgrantia gudaonensis TaxID=376427 RepID=A0A1G9D569_9GAMM|nr:hypothetical protein [Halomonas gudaonensis]SDK59021.1 hypothetical protein SAMN04487954_12018 [Halomonas gudaonensis]
MGMDQAAGLRQWASGGESADEAADAACPRHVAEMLVELSDSDEAAALTAPQPEPASAATNEEQAADEKPAASSGSGRAARASTAGSRGASSSADTITLMVLGLPGTSERQARRVTELFEAWAAEGRDWVGDPGRWRVVPLEASSPHLPVLAAEQSRWALWVGSDEEAFRRSYRVLKQVAERGGPRRLLAVHPPDVGPKGLLDNLQRVAARYFGIELLVLAR